MIKFILSVFVIIVLSGTFAYSQSPPVYICKVDDKNDILLEDHITREKNRDKLSDPHTYYEKYTMSIIDMLVSTGYYRDKESVYYFDKELKEFENYTDIKIGETFFISTPDYVYKTTVIGYKIFLEDAAGVGNIFYVVLENPEPANTMMGGLCIASINSTMKNLDTIGVTDSRITEKFKDFIKKIIPDNIVQENDFNPYESFKVFGGHFVNEIRMPQRPTRQYLVSYLKRTSPETYSSVINIYDEDGVLLKEFLPVQIDSFDYRSVIGVADVNNDGKEEILTEWGYYEGLGSEIYKFDGENFVKIADGFFYGI